MAGRKPKPTAVKTLTGNPGKRALNKAEPKPARGLPPMPQHLSALAKGEWKRIAAQLDRLGLLTGIDVAAFSGYVEAFSTWVKAKAVVAKKGLTYEAHGIIRKRPEVGIMADAARQMRQYAIEFGMTPSARSRVSASLTDPNQPPLPGAKDWPEQPDPNKPSLPPIGSEAGFTDEDFFGTRH